MKFKKSYLKKIVQEEIMNLQDNNSPIEIHRDEMAQVFANVEHIVGILRHTIPATDPEALKALADLDMLHTWFNTKLAGAEDPETMEWLQEPEEEEKKK